MEIVREYTNGELTVIWKPGLCIHAGVCVRMLPQVYRPRLRPWVDPTRATTRQLIEQIERCPSGALSYRLGGATTPDDPAPRAAHERITERTTILIARRI